MKTLPTLDIRTDFRELKLPKGRVLEQLNEFNELTAGALKHPHGRVLIERKENGQLQLEVNKAEAGCKGTVPIVRRAVSEDFPRYLAGLTRTAAQVANSDKYEAVFMTNNPVLERALSLMDKEPDKDLVAEIIGKAIPTEKKLDKVVYKASENREKEFLLQLVGADASIKDNDLALKIKDNLWDKLQRLESFIERFKEFFGEGDSLKTVKAVLKKLEDWLEKLKDLQKKHKSSTTLVDLCPSIVSGGRELGKSGSHKNLVTTTKDVLEALSLEPVMAKKMMGLEDYFLSEKVPENA